MFLSKVKGFTLIELIVVIGIVAILITIVIIAVNPARQFGLSRNTDRRNAVLAIASAVHQYASSNGGLLPTSVTGVAINTLQPICNGAVVGACVSGETDLSMLVTGQFLTALPKDPGGPNLTAGADTDTRYGISRDTNNRITVTAYNEEAGVADGSITITR